MCLERFVFFVDLLKLHTPTQKKEHYRFLIKGGVSLGFIPPNLGLSSSAICPPHFGRAWRPWRKPAKNLEPNPRSFRSPKALYLVFLAPTYTPNFDEEIRKMMRVYNVFPFKYGYFLGISIYARFQGRSKAVSGGVSRKQPLFRAPCKV